MRVIPLLLMVSLISAVATAERPSELAAALDKHRSAMTADPASPAIESISVNLLIEEPAFTLSAIYQASREGGMRIDVYDGETRVFSEGIAGNDGWQWLAGDDNPLPVTLDGRAALERGIVGNLYGLHERPALGYELQLDTAAVQADATHWQIVSRAPDGFEEVFFINRDTGFIDRKYEVSALHPDQDGRKEPVITYLDDYRARGGRYFAFKSEKRASNTGELIQQVTVADIQVNAVADNLDRLPLPNGWNPPQ